MTMPGKDEKPGGMGGKRGRSPRRTGSEEGHEEDREEALRPPRRTGRAFDLSVRVASGLHLEGIQAITVPAGFFSHEGQRRVVGCVGRRGRLVLACTFERERRPVSPACRTGSCQ